MGQRQLSFPDAQVEAALAAGLQGMGISATPAQREQLREYLRSLWLWNQSHNLTAVTDPVDMVGRHVLDSLSFLPYLDPSQPAIDVGSGAGLPGIPLAVLCPALSMTLVEPASKRVAFLRYLRLHLALPKVEVFPDRMAAYPRVPAPVQVLSRATAPLARLLDWCRPAYQVGSRLLWTKGSDWRQEIDCLPTPMQTVWTVTPLEIPGQPCRFLLQAQVVALGADGPLLAPIAPRGYP